MKLLHALAAACLICYAAAAPAQLSIEITGAVTAGQPNPDGLPVVFLHGGPGSGCSPLHRRFFDPKTAWVAVMGDLWTASPGRGLHKTTDGGKTWAVQYSDQDFILKAKSLGIPVGPGRGSAAGSLVAYCLRITDVDPIDYDLTETFQFVDLCTQLGVKILNLSAGSPYYNPHIQRPAAFPPSDGYLPPEDPLVGVARHLATTRRCTSERSRPAPPCIQSSPSRPRSSRIGIVRMSATTATSNERRALLASSPRRW